MKVKERRIRLLFVFSFEMDRSPDALDAEALPLAVVAATDEQSCKGQRLGKDSGDGARAGFPPVVLLLLFLPLLLFSSS